MQVEYAQNSDSEEDAGRRRERDIPKEHYEGDAGSRGEGAGNRKNEWSPSPRADVRMGKHLECDDDQRREQE